MLCYAGRSALLADQTGYYYQENPGWSALSAVSEPAYRRDLPGAGDLRRGGCAFCSAPIDTGRRIPAAVVPDLSGGSVECMDESVMVEYQKEK